MNDKPRRLVDYILVKDTEPERLCVLVKDFVKSGYVPLGGISFSNWNNIKQYTQAMIKTS